MAALPLSNKPEILVPVMTSLMVANSANVLSVLKHGTMSQRLPSSNTLKSLLNWRFSELTNQVTFRQVTAKRREHGGREIISQMHRIKIHLFISKKEICA